MMRIGFLIILAIFQVYLGNLVAQPMDATYSVPGTYTYTVPAGYTATLTVQIWAGGGGGTGSAQGYAKGGGGGGGYSETIVSLASGGYTVIVGSGGNSTNSYVGQNSSFNGVVSTGGGSGGNSSGGDGGMGNVANGGDGGLPGNTTNASQGGGGGGGGSGVAASNGIDGTSGTMGTGGSGGTPSGGAGGNVGFKGIDGTSPGGGGGGKGAVITSGGASNGGNGQVIVTVSNVLPVEYLDFSAKKFSSNVMLSWSTSSEQNNDYFSIERSENGLSFDAIGKVAGFGNSSAKVDYTFIDENPLNGTSYYRLKQVDFDGKVEYSSIISVKSENQKGDIDAKYLIGSQDLFISTPLSNYTITINDISGRVVRTFSGYSDDVTHISLSDLNQGLYIAVINGQFTSSKLRFKI